MKKLISKISIVASILTTISSISLNKNQYNHHNEINHTHLKNTRSNANEEIQEISNKEERQKNQRVKRAKGEDKNISPYGIVTPPIDPSDPDDGGYFTDNEPKDNQYIGASELDFTKNKKRIRATLSSPNDKDYYRFSLIEKTKIQFNYKGPEIYLLELSRYVEPNKTITPEITTYPDSSAYKGIITYSYDLYPGTYYMCVSTEALVVISSQFYEIILLTMQTNHETKKFHLTKGSKEKYSILLWQNEFNPQPSPEYIFDDEIIYLPFATNAAPASDIPIIDPIYVFKNNGTALSTEKRPSITYLDSILYIWDKKAIAEIKELVNDILDLDLENRLKEIRVEVSEDLNTTILSIFVGDVLQFSYVMSGISLILSIFNFVSVESKIEKNKRLILQRDWLEALKAFATCFSDEKNENQDILYLPRYYTLDYLGNVSEAGVHYGKFNKLYTFTPYLKNNQEKNFAYREKIIDSIQFDKQLNQTLYGTITAFKDGTEFKSFSTGNGGGSKINYHTSNKEIISATDNNLFSFYDDKYHIANCEICNESYLIEHVFTYDTHSYSCVYCQYSKSIIKSSTIEANSMPFPQIYNLDPIEQDIIDSNGNTIKTKRLRTGMIEGYLTMSSISNDADRAYIEYHFDKPITVFSFFVGLWGPNEWFMAHTSLKIETYVNGEWIEIKSVNVNKLSDNKTELRKLSLELETCSSSIRLLVEDKKNSSDWNRGRVVLGDIHFTQLL